MDSIPKIHVKVQYEDETRRFALTSPSFTEFFTVAVRLFNIQAELIPRIVARYQDDENDWITVDKDEEFTFAASICKSPLKIKLLLKDRTSKQQQTDATTNTTTTFEPKCQWGTGEGRKHAWMAKMHCSINQRIAFIQWRLDSEDLDNKDREKLTYRLGKLKEKAKRNAGEHTEDKKWECKKGWKHQKKWKGKHLNHRIAFIRWQLETVTDPQELERLKQCLENLTQELNSFKMATTDYAQGETPKDAVPATLRAELGHIRGEMPIRRAAVQAATKEWQQLKLEKAELDTCVPKDKSAIIAKKLCIEDAKKKVHEKRLELQTLNKRATEIKTQLGFGKRK